MSLTQSVAVQRNAFVDRYSDIVADPSSRQMIVDNIAAIQRNAFSEIGLECRYRDSVELLSLNLNTFRLVPRQVPGLMQQYLPSLISSYFITEEPLDDNAVHIKDFITFLLGHLDEIPHVEIGDEKEHLSIHLVKQHRKVDMGLAYLSDWYRMNRRPNDHAVTRAAQEALSLLTMGCALVEGLTSLQYNMYSGKHSFLENPFKLLEMERYSSLKSMMQIRKHSWDKESKMEKKLRKQVKPFLAACLRMKETELKEFCVKIEDILKNRAKGTKSDFFFGDLLNDARFSSIHELCIAKLLRGKKCSESQEQFEERNKGQHVQQAFNIVQNKIDELKVQPDAEEKLLDFLHQSPFCNDLSSYEPYHTLYEILFTDYFFPREDGYPGLPVDSIGCRCWDKFVVNLLMAGHDLNTLDRSTPENRVALLKAAEFLFIRGQKEDFNRIFDQKKLTKWMPFFPEVTQFPNIMAVIEPFLNKP